MKKKILFGLIILTMCFTLVGCGSSENKTNNKTNSGSSSSEKAQENDEKSVNNTSSKYDYKDGVLTQIIDEEGNPKQTDFVIDGIILVGNRHEYRGDDITMETMDYLVEKGYNKEGINKDFYLNEWIEFYIDTKYSKSVDDVKILVVPHKKAEELEKMSYSKLEELATEKGGFVLDYKTPEEENHKYVGDGYVQSDYPEGKYDILFTYKGKLAYFININLTKEINE